MITAQVDASKILAAGNKLPASLRKYFGDALDHISLKFLKNFKQKTQVKFRSRGLFTKFKRVFTVPSSSRSMGVEIFTMSKIAVLHEFGGDMRGKGGLQLAVPLSARAGVVQTASGAVKKSLGGTPYNRDIRKVKNIRPIKINGQTFLARVQKKTQDVLPLFVLKDSVKLPARLKFYDTWTKIEPEAIQIVDRAIGKAAVEAWR